MPPLSSILTFETPSGRSSIPPPTTHLLCTTTYPAPSNFLPLHYARIFCAENDKRARKVVIWIGCDGSSEAHQRSALKRNGAIINKDAFVYIDALEEILEGPIGSSSTQSAALNRLHTRVEEQLDAVSRYNEMDDEEDASESSASNSRCLVILDDATALAWSIAALDKIEDSEESQEEKRIDARVQFLRSKRKGAIQNDAVGTGVAKWIEESLRKSCDANSAILLTHLSAESTTIIPPAMSQATRGGGAYGVGTGFDADDAGEENEEEELYEDVVEESGVPLEGNAGEDNDKDFTRTEKTSVAATFAKESIDWRVDSLLRKLLLTADLWIEIRGLRSGKARDCHGEICIHTLFRPSVARQQALPRLPLPSDPLRSLRSKDRISRPLATFNSLSINSSTSSSLISGKAWKMDIQCSGRDSAMLFRVEAVGEAVAWTRGGRR